jgi:hypothetical protein
VKRARTQASRSNRVTLLSIGYMISRGLAKAGSRWRNDA